MNRRDDSLESFSISLSATEQRRDGSFHFQLPREFVFEDGQYNVSLDVLVTPVNVVLVANCRLFLRRVKDGAVLAVPLDEAVLSPEELKKALREEVSTPTVLSFMSTQGAFIEIVKDGVDVNVDIRARVIERDYELSFSPQLERVLNVQPGLVIRPGDSHNCVDVNLGANTSAFMVKCDLLESSVCNDHYDKILGVYAMKRERRRFESKLLYFDYRTPRVEQYTESTSRAVAAGRVL